MHRAYKYRLYPTDQQSAMLNAWFAAVRLVYNAALEQRNIYGRSISKDGPDYWGRPTSFDWRGQKAELLYKSKGDVAGIENDPDLKWIVEKEVPKDCLDAAVQDLHKAFKNFFGYIEKTKKKIPAPKVGYPKPRTANKNNSVSFKAFRRQKVNGISVSKPNIVFGQDSVKLPKIGRVRYNRHKKFYGDPKTVEVIREGHEYHVILVTDHPIKSVKHAGEAIGVDLGVKLPVCLSNGEASWPDGGLEELEKKVRKAQKKLSRATKGSRRRQKARAHLAAIKRKQARRRTAKTHQITTELTRSFKYIALEDLKVKNMTASAKGTEEEPGKKVKQKAGLNRAVLNVSFYKIREQLLYKAEKSGTVVKFVDPKGTSQMCNKCGHKSKANRKKQAKFKCTNPTCGHEDNADVNAAKNILRHANPSAAVLGRRKSPSKSTALELASKIPIDLATIKASGSCFQPVSVLKMAMKTEGYPHVR